MKIVDRGNVFDKANNRDYGDANPNNITHISEEIYRFYIQFPQCEYCPCNSGLGDPLCDHPENCRLRNHDCSSRNKSNKPKKPKPVIETKRFPNNPLSIFLSRTTLIFLYYNQIPFIFRPGRHYNIIQHHQDGNPLNDRPENIAMIFIESHNKLHSKERTLLKIIKFLTSLMKSEDENFDEYKKLFDSSIHLREKVMNETTEPRVWSLIEEECKDLGMNFIRPNENKK